jgi:hypothetical protein
MGLHLRFSCIYAEPINIGEQRCEKPRKKNRKEERRFANGSGIVIITIISYSVGRYNWNGGGHGPSEKFF